MNDKKLPDLSKVRESVDKRKLPPQTSAEDTSNWENRAIALPNPNRPYAEFIKNKLTSNLDLVEIDEVTGKVINPATNPYVEQERINSVKDKK